MAEDNNNSNSRKKKFVDNKVQSAILLRLCIYWFAGVLFVFLPLTFIQTFQDPTTNFFAHFGGLVSAHWPVLASAMLLLPFVLMDAVKLSHRFVGPIHKLRLELQNFSDTGKMNKFKFRSDDFWRELAPAMNKLTERIEELEAQLRSPTRNQPESEKESINA
ncbi:MAG: hypothetical protein AAF456_22340 [Planctomycetota bacterium]